MIRSGPFHLSTALPSAVHPSHVDSFPINVLVPQKWEEDTPGITPSPPIHYSCRQKDLIFLNGKDTSGPE